MLADFIGEDPNGEWDLAITVEESFGAGELNRWCVIIWSVAPLEDVICEVSTEDDPATVDVDESIGHVNVMFTAGSDYTSLEILNYTDIVETVVDDFVTGDLYELSVGPLPVPQLASLEIVGIIDEDDSPPFACRVPLQAAPLECLEGSEGDIVGSFGAPDPGPMYIDIVEFSEELDIADITVQVEITYDFLNDLDVAIAAPFDTVVMLHNHRPGIDIDVLYWELGATGIPLTGGNVVQPTGPGSLSDFVGGTTHNEDGVGAWALAATARTASVAFGPGTVDSWTLCIYAVAPAFAPTGISCEAGDELGTVSASAIAGADYTRVRWFVNGEVADDIDFDPPLEAGVDDITFTSAVQPVPSLVRIQVQGFTGEGDDQVPGPLVSCSQPVLLAAPFGMGCVGESGEIIATWSIPAELPDGYDFYDVFVDGVYIETLTDGLITTYTTDEGFELDTVHRVGIAGGLDDPPASSDRASCRALILAEMDVVECAPDTPAIARGVGTGTSTVSVLDLGTVLEVEVLMDGDATFFANIDQTLSHVETGSSLVLHDTLGRSSDSDYCMLWTDDGDLFGSATDLDGCLPLLPQGGSFAETFGFEVSDGDWTLTCIDPTFAYSVNSWCLRMNICETLPPTDLVADLIDSDIFVTWTNEVSSSYTEVRVYLDGDLFDTLGGDEEEVSILGVEDGHHRVYVAGFSDVTDCEAGTPSVFVAVGFSETCVTDIGTLTGATVVDITVFDSVIVADIELVLDLEVTFGAGAWFHDVTSPFGTRVALHSRQGGSGGDGFQLIWSNREDSDPRGNGIPYDCEFCIMNSTPGDLDDFQGEVSDGTWEWEMEVVLFGPGDLNLACIDVYEGCPGVPPSEVLAEVDGSDIVLTWRNNPDAIEYNSLEIERNGEIIVEDLDPEEESYTDEKPLSGFYTYRIIAVVTDPDTGEDCDAGSAPSDRLAKGIQVDCMEASSVAIGLVATSIEVEVFDDPTPDDVQVVLDITFAFIPYLDITIENPDGDEVKLFTGLGLVPGDAIYDDIDRAFADSGEGQPAFDYTDGTLIQPSGPGALEDFLDGSIVGIWTLEITSSFATPGTLNTFCMQFLVGCPLDRPSIDGCTILDDNALPPIALTFSGIDPDVVDEILILRNGVLIATLESDAIDYLDEDISGTGRQTYRVVAFDDELDCGKSSGSCESEPLGRFTVCEARDEDLISGALGVFAVEFTYENDEGEEPSFADPDDSLVGEVEVDIDMTTAWAGDIDLYLLSPENTIITLNNSFGSSTPDIKVTYSDAGGPFLLPGNTTCECLVKPQGPGEMSDFDLEEPRGTWLLLATFTSFGPATLNDWCLGIFPDRLPVDSGVEFLRGDVDNNGIVNFADGIYMILGGRIACRAAADIDGNGSISLIADSLRLLNWSSGNALSPPAPFPDCGVNPDDPYLDYGPPCDTDDDGVNDGGNGCSGDPTA